MGFGDGGRSSSIFTSCHRQCYRRPCCALCPSLAWPRPDLAQPSRHSSLPPWIVSAAVSVAGWKARDDGTAGFDTLLSRRPIRPSSPFDQPAPRLASQGTRAASCIWCVRRGVDAARCHAAGRALRGSLFGRGQGGNLFPPAISRGRFQPPSPPCGSAIRGHPDRAGAMCDEQGASHKEVEYRRNQHRAARKGGISGILDARERKKGSRRSLSIAARRGGGTDCPRSRVPFPRSFIYYRVRSIRPVFAARIGRRARRISSRKCAPNRPCGV